MQRSSLSEGNQGAENEGCDVGKHDNEGKEERGWPRSGNEVGKVGKGGQMEDLLTFLG